MISHLKLDNKSTIHDPKDIANELNKYFINIGSKLASEISPPNKTHMQFLKTPLKNTFFLIPTNPFEVESAMSQFSDNKAMGPDNIPVRMLKIGMPSLSMILTDLINESFRTGSFPKTLKIARITPLFKGGSRESSNCYRPISIISPISKLIEKLVSKRLIKFLDKFNIISDNQYGFRASHSTNHAIANICEKIRHNVDTNEHTVSIFLDLSKAFDCVNHQILIDKLRHYGIRGVALNFLKSYLSDRTQFTIVNGISSDILNIICGVPQGSTLGPLLFLLYINDVCQVSKFTSCLYADDTCLIMSHKNIRTLEEMCNRELVEIDIWFRANKLTANINKASKFMVSYGSRNVRHYDFEIKMGTSKLERVKTMKYLGVMLDEQLSWDCHIDYIRKKLASATGMLSKLKYYVNTASLINIYHSLFKSRLQYAIVSWGSANCTTLQPLRVLQNRALRHISRASLYTRMDGLYLNYRILKLNDLYRFELGKFMHQFFNNSLPNSFSGFFQELSQIRQRVTRASARGDYNVLRCKKASGQKSIKYQGAKLWNKLSNDIRLAGKNIFKKQLKSWIFAEL